MKNLFIRLFIFAVTAAVAPSILAQQPIYTTLGPGGAFDTSNPAQIVSGGLDGYGDLFTSPVTANVFSVSLALEAVSPGATASISLREDTDGLPGTLVHLFVSSPLPAEPGIATFVSATDFQINAGTQYWLTAVTSDGKADWFFNNQGIDNPIATREANLWSAGQVDGPALAFQINPAPEPTSLALCSLGIASLFFVRRLKTRVPR
jgi:hypothetical protein